MPSAQSVLDARTRLQGHIVDTPLIQSHTLSEICDCDTWFKLENLQMTGSFKERGALNRLLALDPSERKRGVIAASAGNHAQALAYHGRQLGISVKIVMPRHSPLVKVRATEHWGAEVVLHGETFDDAYRHSREVEADEHRVFIHPFDDPLVIEGQGTLAADLLDQAGDFDALIVPVGGGGLIAGVSTYLKEMAPNIRIIGVEESGCAAMHEALQQGEPLLLPPAPVIADGIAVRQVARSTLQIVKQHVDDLVRVSSDETANAIMLMLEIEKLVVEASAAVTLAALVNRRVPELRGKKVISIISGGNIDVNMLARIINRGQIFDGRITGLESQILDRPGELEKFLSVFREFGANILEVHHLRYSGSAPLGQIGISVVAETRDHDHAQSLKEQLLLSGYRLKE